MKEKLLIFAAVLIVLILVIRILCAAASKGYPVPELNENHWLRNRPIAHRGLHSGSSDIPENSLKAFDKAIEKEFVIELDVHTTKDGKVVVFHDANLKRMTGLDKEIEDCTFAELSELRLLGSDQTIPLFQDVLNEIGGRVPVLVEIKNEGTVGDLEPLVLDLLKKYNGAYAVQAFNPMVLKWFRINAPEIIRGQLASRFKGEDLAWYKKILLKNLLMNFQSRPAFIAYNIDDLPKVQVKRCRRQGVPVIGWVIRSDEDWNEADKYIDNVIFERPFFPEKRQSSE